MIAIMEGARGENIYLVYADNTNFAMHIDNTFATGQAVTKAQMQMRELKSTYIGDYLQECEQVNCMIVRVRDGWRENMELSYRNKSSTKWEVPGSSLPMKYGLMRCSRLVSQKRHLTEMSDPGTVDSRPQILGLSKKRSGRVVRRI